MKIFNIKSASAIFVTVVALILSTGCTSSSTHSPGYRAAKGAGYGYRESKIAEDRYRVSYKSRGNNRGEAEDYALLRAAELTLLEDFDWFVVIRQDTQVDHGMPESGFGASTSYRSGPDYVTTRDCGLLTCTTSTRPAPTSYSASLHTGSHAQNKRVSTETSLEIRMGRGVRPAGTDSQESIESYDALEVRNNLNGN